MTHEQSKTEGMRERFDEKFYEEVNSFMGVAFGDKKLDGELKHFIEQEIKLAVEKEREEIVEWIEKQDWECYEQTFITKDIINAIKNRT